MNPARTLAVIAAVLAGGLALGGCATTQAPPAAPVAPVVKASPTVQFNDTDVTFAQQLIALRRQALWLAQQGVERAQAVGVKQLATQIAAEQGPQIQQLTTWLTQWGLPVPAMPSGTALPPLPSMGPGMPSMPPAQELSQLQSLSGEQFDQKFLELMIPNHEGAIASATAELANGVNPSAKQLAEQVKTSQSAELEQLRQLLGAAPSPTE
ncbi:DUF305 domain-containing protein [Catellatospora sichuanensis]|uniref:DUF305 domain-containing protein n=1 Tax=Catellatospora sichuanensis TaxID=1969805 RepID=UPI0016435815|nr:DUF305 domain-containing protein [Catellatospora sichuanensis]